MKNTLLFKAAIIFSFFIFHFSFVHAQLSGTYTINPSGSGSTNYTSFTNAVNSLAKNGISGPVVFNVADGTYQEQVYIHAIKGSSGTNTISFQSANGDSSKVILTDTTGNGNYYDTIYTLKLDTVSFITFKQITIQRTGGWQYAVIEMNSPKGCSFLNDQIFTDGYADIIVCHGDSGNSYKNILFRAPDCALEDNVNDTGVIHYEVNTVFEKNRIELFDSLTNISLLFFNLNSLDISENTFSGVLIAIDINNCLNNIFISKNRIFCSGAGIETNYCRGTVDSPAIISNNSVSIGYLGSNTTGYGILSEADSDLLIAYNTINMRYSIPYQIFPAPVALAVYESYYPTIGSHNKVLDNNIINSGGSFCISMDTIIKTDTFNYNNLYTNGNYIAQVDTLYEQSLSDWQMATGFDLNSISVNPLFSSPNNLYPFSSQLAAGIPISELKDDIDGNIRSTSKPDIGAYEFGMFKNDAKVFSIDSPGPGKCGGTYNVYVTILNTGANTLKTATINWKIDGNLQSPYQWSGTLALLEKSTTINIGSYIMNPGVPHNIVCWISEPNAVIDSNKINDSTSRTFLTGLSGVFTIGGINPDYQYFKDAIYDLYYRGLCGPIVFNVANGGYGGNILLIHSIAGSSPINRITFQSASGDSTKVQIGGPELDSCNFISFKKMRIESNINLNRSTGDSFVNCFIDQNLSGNNYGIYLIIDSGGKDNTFYNNLISGEYQQSLGYSYIGINKNPVSGSAPKLIDNNFQEFEDTAISISNSNGFLIKGNSISGIIPQSEYQGDTFRLDEAIHTSKCNGNWEISQNVISVLEGIDIDIENEGTGLIANNITFSSFNLNDSINPLGGTIGGVLLSADSVNIYFNNIIVEGGNNSNSYGLKTGNSVKQVNIVDNNIVNTAEGYAINVDNISSVGTMDYNNYKVHSSSIGVWGNSPIVSNIQDWQKTTGMDVHSLSINPYYSLWLWSGYTTNDSLKGKGIAIAGITTDINGIIRPNPPTIGANEITGTGLQPIQQKENNITLYPNPTTSTFNIESTNNLIQSIAVFDITGKEVYSLENLKTQNESITVGNLPSGIYLIKMGLYNGTYEAKFMKE